MIFRLRECEHEDLKESLECILHDDYYSHVISPLTFDFNNYIGYTNNKIFVCKNSFEGTIRGMVTVTYDEKLPHICSISNLINFDKMFTFHTFRDMIELITILKKEGIRKLEWSVNENNPAFKIYKKLEKYGARHVGYFSEAVYHEGGFVDLHMFEMSIELIGGIKK